MQLFLATAATVVLAAACPPSLFPSWVQDLNTLVGLISFAITIGTWWQVRYIRLSFRSRAQLPPINGMLASSVAALDEMLDQPTLEWPHLRRELSSASARLETALPFATPQSRQIASEAMQVISETMHHIDSDSSQLAHGAGSARDALNRALIHLSQASSNFQWE